MHQFQNLIGQPGAVSALRHALETDTQAGAYLITGPQGSGRGAMAQAFAAAACCLQPHRNPFDACGVCDSCVRAATVSQPEITVVRAAGELMQIGQFWDRDGKGQAGLLSRTLHFAPETGRRRVYILEGAERLSEPAANSLLKVLEEPPPYVLFLLLAPHPARMLPTIVSRCQVVRLVLAAADDLAAHLVAAEGLEPERALALASYTQGRVGAAVTLARSPAAIAEIDTVIDLVSGFASWPRMRALRAGEQIRKAAEKVSLLADSPSTDAADSAPRERAGRRQIVAVLDLLASYYRDLLALAAQGNTARLINANRRQEMVVSARGGTAARWMACLDSLALARRRIEANGNAAMVTELLAISLLDHTDAGRQV